jgi:hypothetical protein
MFGDRRFHWALALSLAAFASQASGQINEADRLARCQNNRDALANLQAQQRQIAYLTPGAVWTGEQVSRARTALRSITGYRAELRDRRNWLLEWTQAGKPENSAATWHAEEEKRLTAQIRAIAGDFGILCPPLAEDDCSDTAQKNLTDYIDQFVAANGQNERLNQQMEAHRTNLAALRCDLAAAPAQFATNVPGMAGSWRGGNGQGSIYSFGQDGANVSWTRNDNDEVGTATVSGSSISASYRSSYGSGSASGTIEFDTTGRAVRIRWSNGDTYIRQ